MKLNKLLQARRVLSEHANEPLPTMVAYKMLKFMKASDTEGDFYNQHYREIIEKYAKKDENGGIMYADGQISIFPDKVEECKKALTDLGETEVEAPNVVFTIHELMPIKFTVSELYSLDEFIKEE